MSVYLILTVIGDDRPGLDAGALKAELERLSDDLMVDITLDEIRAAESAQAA